jgi:2-dehydro-3-deoxyphosphogluconate aldolase / (4S)-4-hydroxy-2-oxoglutarate aldolase
MDKQNLIIETLKAQKLLPLFYNDDEAVCIGITRALYAAGIRMIEFTNRGEAAFLNFKALVALRNAEMKDLLLGVGTIRSKAAVKEFTGLGADFLISPVFDLSICIAAQAEGITWIPGCATPGEIHQAEVARCKIVKLFPGNILGPSFVSAVREVFPSLYMMPTGGVEPTKENLEAWFSAGVTAVGMGSKLVTKEMMDNRQYEPLTQKTKALLQLIQSIQ